MLCQIKTGTRLSHKPFYKTLGATDAIIPCVELRVNGASVKKKRNKVEEDKGRVWGRTSTSTRHRRELFSLSLSRDFIRLINYCKLKTGRVESSTLVRGLHEWQLSHGRWFVCTISTLSVHGIGCAPLNLPLVILSRLKVHVARLRRDSLSLAMIREQPPPWAFDGIFLFVTRNWNRRIHV